MVMSELMTLRTLDHPNIVKYFESYNDNKFVYIVMQYVKGKSLLDKIIENEGKDD